MAKQVVASHACKMVLLLIDQLGLSTPGAVRLWKSLNVRNLLPQRVVVDHVQRAIARPLQKVMRHAGYYQVIYGSHLLDVACFSRDLSSFGAEPSS